MSDSLHRVYGFTFLIRSSLAQQDIEGDFVSMLASNAKELGGAALSHKYSGLFRLSYKIKKMKEAHYLIAFFKIEADALNTFKEKIKFNESILRYLCICYEDKYYNSVISKNPDYIPVDVFTLKKHISNGGRILSRRISKTPAKDQRALARKIKRGRFLALLPYCERH